MLPDHWWQGATAQLTPDAERELDTAAHTLEIDDDIRGNLGPILTILDRTP